MEERNDQRTPSSLRDVGEDLQDLGQSTVNLLNDLWRLGVGVITLPLRLLPDETRQHLTLAAREAGYAVQTFFDAAAEEGARAVRGASESLARMGEQDSDEDEDDEIIIYEEITINDEIMISDETDEGMDVQMNDDSTSMGDEGSSDTYLTEAGAATGDLSEGGIAEDVADEPITDEREAGLGSIEGGEEARSGGSDIEGATLDSDRTSF